MLNADGLACVVGILVGAVVLAASILSFVLGAWVTGLIFLLIGAVCWAAVIRAMLDAANL